jgi:site-specific DNA recombinase
MLSGHAPYGYVFLHHRVVEHPKEQFVVQKIMALWKTGHGSFSIAKKLNTLGIKSRKNSKWHHKTITKIIKRTGAPTPQLLKRKSK